MGPQICERIKMNRKRIGLTQEQLGHALGVQKSAIQKYEAGITGMKLDTIIQLADVFGISVSSLLGEDLSDRKVIELIYDAYGAMGMEMFDMFKRMTSEGRLKVLAYAQDIHPAYEKK